MSRETKKFLIVIVIILLMAASRLIKHPFNFTPITAMSIFAGCYLRRHWGVVFPLGCMLVSDYFIGFYDWKLMVAVYVGIGMAYYVGWILRNKIKWHAVIGAALASSLIFFITSNFAVWIFYNWYPHTWEGLLQCFTLAIPFFKNSLAGDLIYTSAIFGVYELARKYLEQRGATRILKNA